MKKSFAAIAAFFAATAAHAGSIAYVAPEVTMIEEPAGMGGSGAWIIPLVIIAVLALALSQESEELEPCESDCDPT